jgi:hypothetical protein
MSNPLPPSTPITLDAKNPVVIYRIETDIVPKDAIVETSDVFRDYTAIEDFKKALTMVDGQWVISGTHP